MQNELGQSVELYLPRRCDWTNRVIEAQDHASVMINIARLDPKTGVATGEVDTISLGGYVRSKGESDMAMNNLTKDL
ncbi:40S ribosomal protein S21 [Blastocystis sp. ATCC 50177/Nand II]|uniref:40S ribosomal protein S21 n=1 Tax=Blastocystis sp. subtype 1 (strain ATCC 50177 / NandII) TaxID=478820 RepID=A0A196SJD7_BLAHN|nr:40S ribosomal protein S21 [Blastocystis sp. ATCC 50177/Nand II]